MRRIAAALLLFSAISAGAVTIAPGDVAVAPGGYCCCITCPPDPLLVLLDNDGHQKATLAPAGAVAFGPNGHLYAGGRLNIVEYDASLAIVRTLSIGNEVFRLAVAPSGDIYAMADAGALTVFSPAGAVKRTLTIPNTGYLPLAFDVGPDSCTIFYTDNDGVGRRYNTCTGQPLANLATGPWRALRTTSDGGYVAETDSTLSVFDANDRLLRTYSSNQVGAPWALAFDSTPGVLWWMAGNLGKLTFASGVRAPAGSAIGNSIAVNGELRPASSVIAAADIPALSTTLLAALAIALIALATQRLGR